MKLDPMAQISNCIVWNDLICNKVLKFSFYEKAIKTWSYLSLDLTFTK